MRRLLSQTALIALLLIPLGAEAQYLTPEDVLLRDQNAIIVPKNRREAQEAAAQQEADRQNQHPSTLQEPGTTPPAAAGETEEPTLSEEDPSLHPSAPEEPIDESELDPATLRLLERIQAAADANAQAWEAMQSTSVHAGAPLSDTGPAETMTVVVLLGAIAWTVWRSRGMRGMTVR